MNMPIGRAYPSSTWGGPVTLIPNETDPKASAMILRDQFACAAMQGMCAGSQKYHPEEIARLAYTVADEMLKAREA